MKRTLLLLSIGVFLIAACNKKSSVKQRIVGSWKLVYNEIKEADSIQIKDLSNIDFIKIINKTHFSFINQPTDSLGSFYAGAGTYTIAQDNYTETLSFIGYKPIRNQKFHFKIIIKGDSLIQFGREKVAGANIDREIIEKYVRIK